MERQIPFSVFAVYGIGLTVLVSEETIMEQHNKASDAQ